MRIVIEQRSVHPSGEESSGNDEDSLGLPIFLHPTDRGAQIRTLGMLKELNQRHEIHFAALNDPRNLEGLSEARSIQPLFFAEHSAPGRRSIGIIPQLAASFLHPQPMAVFRYSSRKLRQMIDAWTIAEHTMPSSVIFFFRLRI